MPPRSSVTPRKDSRPLSIDDAKVHPERHRWIKYRLSYATVYQAPAGHCFTDHLDHVDHPEAITPEVDENALTPQLESYIRAELASNDARVAKEVALATSLVPARGARVLDIGAGTGRFIAAMQQLGADVKGIELSDASVIYARREHGLSLHKQAVGSAFWHAQEGSFDLITMWDVLEHVDFPLSTLRDAAALLRPGGFLVIDTPSRDGTFHRIGDLTYRLSMGRFPTLLDLMYSSHAFGHKQILSLQELRELLEQAGLEVQSLERTLELAMPTESYLRKLAGTERFAGLAPLVRIALSITRPWNKARAIARRPSES